MEKTSESKTSDPEICINCNQFFANPELGNYCSKCFKENKEKIQKTVIKNDLDINKKLPNLDTKDELISNKPKQVIL